MTLGCARYAEYDDWAVEILVRVLVLQDDRTGRYGASLAARR